jgi:outer membrane protein assembly factor BamD
MKYISNIILYLFLVLLISCSGAKKEEIVLDSTDIEMQMIEAYNKGLKALNDGDALFAAKNFNIVENIYPQSIWAPRSILLAAYSFYTQNYYGDAIEELERFLKKYPENENYPYAYFLLANCYYELIVDEKKDLSSISKSKEYFLLVVNKYPNTDYALDSRFKLNLIDNILASKEIYIGKYYLTRKKWIPAINRFKNVIEKYDQTEYVEEALHRLVEINYKLGLIDESKKYAAILGYNYQSSRWYKESYRVLNKTYIDPKEIIKKDKKNFIFKKFKELFD